MQPPQSTERARAQAGGASANNGNVFGNVMGSGPGQGPAEQGPAHTKVYASVYSGVSGRFTTRCLAKAAHSWRCTFG